jgi:hypothetical protein
LAGRIIDVRQALGPAMARDDQVLHLVAIHMRSDRKSLCQQVPNGRLAGALVS